MKLELSEQQRRVLATEPASISAEVVDPVSHREYVLVAREQYERLQSASHRRDALESGLPEDNMAESTGIPAGVRRAQEAFWKDLPELLGRKAWRGQWVCYHENERVGIGTYENLVRECIRRNLPDEASYMARIRPRTIPPWEPEEIEPLGAHHREP